MVRGKYDPMRFLDAIPYRIKWILTVLGGEKISFRERTNKKKRAFRRKGEKERTRILELKIGKNAEGKVRERRGPPEKKNLGEKEVLGGGASTKEWKTFHQGKRGQGQRRTGT